MSSRCISRITPEMKSRQLEVTGHTRCGQVIASCYLGILGSHPFLFFFFLRFYLFIQRRRQGEKETSWFGCLSHAPYWGPGLQPRHVPWLGIKPATPLVCRLALNPLSLTSQGSISLLVELRKGFNSSSVVGRDFRVGLYDCPKMVHNTVCILGFGGQPEV